MATLVAGVDSSTTACTVQVRDAHTGALVREGSAPHPPTTPPRSEQHPHDWWTAFEAALLAAVDELVDLAEISDAVWSTLSDSLDEAQLLDVIFTVGAYDALAMMMKSVRVELDDDLL